MASALERLPNELLDQILSHLTIDAPSLARIHHPPQPHITQSSTKDLKHLAQTSCHLLDVVRPRLFAHAWLELQDEIEFRSFILRTGLGRYVTSLVVINSDASDASDGHDWWRRVLSYLDPARLTLLAPPTFIGDALDTPIQKSHIWAFDIQLQILQLERTCFPPDLSHLPDLAHDRSLLLARPWTSMSFNESSSLKAYNHYEYFLSPVPSAVGEWGTQHLSSSPALRDMVRGLESFSYTAVFPFYNHVNLVLDALVLMPRLRTLTVQLAPDRNNHITETEQRGSMDPNDPWMELDTAYLLVGYEVNQHPALVEFRSQDFHLEDTFPELAQTLADKLGGSGWVNIEQWTWKRIARRT